MSMSSSVEWIKIALERDPTKTRAGIAEALGVDKSAVTRLLSGERQLKFHEAEKIAAYLGAPSPFSLADGRRDYNDPDETAEDDQPISDIAPIFNAEAGSGGQWTIFRQDDPIDWRARAPHFLRSAKVFGFYAPDDAMAPRFLSGEIVWVDPARPVSPGDDVLFIEKRRGKGPETVVLAASTTLSATLFEGRQHRDNNRVRLEPRRWMALHVLPRY